MEPEAVEASIVYGDTDCVLVALPEAAAAAWRTALDTKTEMDKSIKAFVQAVQQFCFVFLARGRGGGI